MAVDGLAGEGPAERVVEGRLGERADMHGAVGRRRRPLHESREVEEEGRLDLFFGAGGAPVGARPRASGAGERGGDDGVRETDARPAQKRHCARTATPRWNSSRTGLDSWNSG